MDFEINIKCGNNENIINRISIIQNQNLDNVNVKSAVKNKMLEFFKKYCMICLSVINPEAKY